MARLRVFEPLPKFVEEKRDLALVMDKDITCGQVEDCIREACAFVKEVTLFDVYEGKQIAEDKKSMAFHCSVHSEGGSIRRRYCRRICQEDPQTA